MCCMFAISWQHLHRCCICCCRCHLGAGVVRVEQTRRSLKFFGRLKVTRGGWGMACFSFFEACSMGRCFLTIFVRVVSLGWYVVTRDTRRCCCCLGRGCRACVRGIMAAQLHSYNHEYMDNICDI